MRWASLAVAGALALAGCGGSDTGSGGGAAAGDGGGGAYGGGSGDGGGQKLALAADPGGALAFDKKELQAKAGTVTIDFSNDSGVPHAVEVEGNGIEKAGKTITSGSAPVTVELKAGTYTFYCPVGQHRQNGMEGTLTVK
jgi:plastocyanin